jgi:hypothetical protein
MGARRHEAQQQGAGSHRASTRRTRRSMSRRIWRRSTLRLLLSPISGTIRYMEVDFSVRDDGQIDASLAGDWPMFNHALSDSISSLPPRGKRGRGPSTYWIDVADRGARLASECNDERPFVWGNITQLRVKGGRVLASLDIDEPSDDDESIALEDFLSLLADWRKRVVASPSRGRFPETYRRNAASA